MPADVTHQPHPPRFRWLKRITLSVLLLLVTLVLLRLLWGWRVQREFDALIASYRASGEPTTAADFAAVPVPDEENAVPLLRQAAASITTAQAIWETDNRNGYVARTIAEADLRLLRQHVAANAAALPLARRARQTARVYWNLPLIPPYSPAPAVGTDRGQQYQLGALLRYAALDAHAAGDDAAAIEYLRDAFFVAHALAQHPDGSFHSYASMSSHRAVTAVFQICPQLATATDTHVPGSSRRPASREQVEALISDLLDERDSDAAAVRTAKALRLYFTDFREHVMSDELPDVARSLVGQERAPAVAGLIGAVVRPVLYRHAIDRLHHIDAVARAIQTPDWRVARAAIGRDDYRGANPNAPFPRPVPFTYVRSADFVNDNDTRQASWRLVYHRNRTAERRAAAIRLAIRAYELDHGARPPTLASLVPSYLPHVPLDPFGDGVATFRYSSAGPWPHLSSHGVDGIDEVALGRLSLDELARSNIWHSSDVAFLLTTHPEIPSSPATSPVKNEDQ